jgi:putative FmdB family regulatory protein
LPTYEYACTACGHRLDAVQSFTDDPLTVCPECGGLLRKVYGAVGIAFKGSGFYKTDSRVGSGTPKSDGEAEKPADAVAASGDTKSDSTTKTDSPTPSSDNGSTPKESKDSKPAASTAS